MKKWSGIALLLVLVMSVLVACGTKDEADGGKTGFRNDQKQRYLKWELLRITLLSNMSTQQ